MSDREAKLARELQDHFVRIRKCAEQLHVAEDSIESDRRLGELEALVYSARQAITDDWSVIRTAHLRNRQSSPPTTLESLA